jgi:hypothetical protein
MDGLVIGNENTAQKTLEIVIQPFPQSIYNAESHIQVE